MWADAPILLSCEHGGNRVPARYRHLFRNAGALLASHAGWDMGALEAARLLRRKLSAPLVAATTTRLLIDLNRSPHHAQLFSDRTRTLPVAERAEIINRYYNPYRTEVRTQLEALMQQAGRVVHVSVHSFTPCLNGEQRNADLGLLYDPQRRAEKRFCDALATRIRSRQPLVRVRRNYPYRGTADGLVTALRQRYSARRYIGLELEFNQRLFDSRRHWQPLLESVAAGLQAHD